MQYDGLVGTAGVVVRRFQEKRGQIGILGATRYIASLLFSVLLTPVYALTRGRRTFLFLGEPYRYFVHWYNATFDNERAVEIALAARAIEYVKGKRILEVGNVLTHYIASDHDILDKYEKGDHVIHEDVATFRPPHPYDLIVSISTMEHVGFDEDPRDLEKIVPAMQNLRSMLAPGGTALITIPVGYNPFLTEKLEREILFDEQHYLRRVSEDNRWEETTKEIALRTPFNTPYTFGNAIVIGIIRSAV